jgi:hypothetical protein
VGWKVDARQKKMTLNLHTVNHVLYFMTSLKHFTFIKVGERYFILGIKCHTLVNKRVQIIFKIIPTIIELQL